MIGPVNGAVHINGVIYRDVAGVYTIPSQYVGVAEAAGLELSPTRSAAVGPTAADIPPGTSRVWKNTGDGTVKLYYNDAGTMKSTALS
jgi:hypothetical protein